MTILWLFRIIVLEPTQRVHEVHALWCNTTTNHVVNIISYFPSKPVCRVDCIDPPNRQVKFLAKLSGYALHCMYISQLP